MNSSVKPNRAIPVARPIVPVAVKLDEPVFISEPEIVVSEARRWYSPYGLFVRVRSIFEWCFGLLAILVGLAVLAAIPILQFLSLGYLLECGGRIARTGRFCNGFIGIRLAARLGGIVAACWLFLLPIRFVADLAYSASIIEPDSNVSRNWRYGLIALIVVTLYHVVSAVANGGKWRHFISPFNIFFVIGKFRRGGFYVKARDAVWETLIALRLPYYFKLGVYGFVAAMIWLVMPISLIALGRSPFGIAPLFGFLGAFLLSLVVIYLPFLQLRLAQTNRFRAAFELSAIRRDYSRAPWMFAISFFITLLFALPLYLLKIEVIPRDAAWLPSLVFVLFIYPTRLLAGWALARALNREIPRHWFFRWTGRLVFLPVAVFYVTIVFFTQYTSWNGIGSLYEQHAFLLPVPFFGL